MMHELGIHSRTEDATVANDAHAGRALQDAFAEARNGDAGVNEPQLSLTQRY